MQNKKVTLAAAYTDADGKDYEADAEVDLPRHEAHRLLDAGLARLPEQGQPKEDEKSDRIVDVLAEVGDDKDKAAAALEAERAGKNRPSLIEKLEQITNEKGN